MPQSLVDAVLRGLEPNPNRRFASMDALLGALQPRPRRRRGVRAAVAAMGLMAAGVVLGLVLPSHPPVMGQGSLARASAGLSASLVQPGR